MNHLILFLFCVYIVCIKLLEHNTKNNITYYRIFSSRYFESIYPETK